MVKKLLRLAIADVVLLMSPSGTSIWADNSVVVESKTVPPGAENVEIRIHLSNDTDLRSVVVPLALREITPGSFVTTAAISWGDRLPSPGPLDDVVINQQRPEQDTICGDGSFGFFAIAYQDGLEHPVDGSPEGVLFVRTGVDTLPPGTDITGSMVLTVDVSDVPGAFEIDTSCMCPATHLLLYPPEFPVIIPQFTKGVITLDCDCPHQSDFNEDGFITALDLSAMIDILFMGASNVQDPACPSPRADFNCDGFSMADDLAFLIDHLFSGGEGPCEPCGL